MHVSFWVSLPENLGLSAQLLKALKRNTCKHYSIKFHSELDFIQISLGGDYRKEL